MTYVAANQRAKNNMTGVALDYVVPTGRVAELITLWYFFRADVPVFSDTERADHAQLRFRLSAGAGSYRFADGVEQAAGDLHVIGPTSGAMQVIAEGPVLVFGAGVTPAGWAALIGTDASTLLDRVVDAEAIFGPQIREVAAALAAAQPDIAAMQAVAESFVLARAAQDEGATGFVRAVDDWLAGHPSPAIADLIAATGLSRRQVERRCNALYGAPPKLLARKYRALRAAVAMWAHDEHEAELREGFYDQSHLIREVKQFTGLTPKMFAEQPSLLQQLTMSRRRALGGKVKPIISDT